jgi:hypothetical protein
MLPLEPRHIVVLGPVEVQIPEQRERPFVILRRGDRQIPTAEESRPGGG